VTGEPSVPPLPAAELEAGLAVARSRKVAIFVVCYNHESQIERTLRRIPGALMDVVETVYVIDDQSTDRTRERLEAARRELPKLRAFTTPWNQGYGGNQKLGYRFAIEQGFDLVVLLHGDGQYAPEVLPRLLAPFADDSVAAVLGSRMLERGAARRGGMPLYKFVGNRILTTIQNRLLGSRLSEFHSGYRAYRVATLARLPFEQNTDDFHFDTEIIAQLLLARERIVEVPIPTYYGDEICHVNGVPYAGHCLATVGRAFLNRFYLVYHPKFDVDRQRDAYVFKRAPTSVHQFVVRGPLPAGARVVELGAGSGDVSRALHERGARVVAIDQRRPGGALPFAFVEGDLDRPFGPSLREALGGPADLVLALDVLEHLDRPEAVMDELRGLLRPGGRLVASTGNVAYLVVRLAHLFGQFNYGKKGILDLTHQRLFTIRSFRRLLAGAGFRVDRVRGFGPPIEDMVGRSVLLRFLDRLGGLLARLWPGLFAYQILVEATRLEEVKDLLARTLASETKPPR
jgi:glycosyltransferase involved in cell wall biosynthesis